MPDLDIVGGAAVDVVPVIPEFHTKLKALVLPIADKVGEEAGKRMGEAISKNIVISIPQAINQGGKAGVRVAGKQGSDAGGAFSRSLKRHLEVAFKAMPKLDIRISQTGADAELARLRAKLEQLSGKRIGIDVDAHVARAEVLRIEEELKRLGAQHPNIRVRADTATARAALAALREEIDAVDRKRINVPARVDTSQASSALMSLGIQIAALTAIPLGPALVAGLGAVVSMATAAAAGVGAVALVGVGAVKEVANALQLKTAAENEAKNATDKSAASASKAASKALQLAGAQASLASATRNASRSVEAAERAVAQAQRAAADAAQRAAEQRQAAADNVRRAEQQLTDAKRTARQAEQDLTQARADAAQQLRELSDRLIDGHLDQREATLRVQQAQEDLNATLADTTATDVQREAAQLAYDRAVANAKRQKDDFAELQKSAAKQRKAGVEGSDAVKAATERVSDAQRGVADQTDALAKAQADATKAQRDGARDVADAQDRIAVAVDAAKEAQVSAAESIANAQRGLASAQLSSATAAGTARTAADDYAEALANLTPAGKDLFDAIAGPSGLKKAFTEWQRSLQPEVLPIFTRGITGMKDSLPGLTPLVLGAAAGIQTLMDKASAQMQTPFWEGFKSDLKDNVQPAVEGFGTAFGNIIAGLAGVVDAFLPHMDGIVATSDRITGRFANWGKSLKGSPDFEKFLAYVKDTSPGLAHFVGQILTAALDVSKAVAPLSTTMMAVVGPVFEAISKIATENPEVVQALWSLWAAQKAIALGMVAFSAAMTIYESVVLLATIATAGFGTVLSATGILPIIRAVLIVVGLLVAGFVLAYKNCDWFRAAVDGAWQGIQQTVSFVWDSVLKPTFSAIWTALKSVGDAAMWLWNKAIKPAFDFIGKAAQLLVTAVIVAFLLPAKIGFELLGAAAKWLWDKAIGPAFGWIGEKATWLWEQAISPALGDAKTALEALGDAATWLWEKVIDPAFGFVGEKATWLWEKAIEPALSSSKDSFDALGEAAKWLWDKVLEPVFGFVGEKAKWLYEKAIKPPFDSIMDAVGFVADAFKTAKDNIKTQWDKLKEIAKKPVKFIIDHVYNKGIVPLWNGVAKVTGAGTLHPIDLENFHTGGIMSGYSPGRDDRVIAVGGGEAVMRPEWTRAVGADKINAWNAAARSGGVSGVQRAISNGMPAFKDGGVVGNTLGWFKGRASDVGDFVSGAVDYVDPRKLFSKAKSYIVDQLKPYLTNPWARSVVKIPGNMLSALKDKAVDLFGFGGGREGGGEGGGSWIKPVNVPYGTRFGVAGRMWSSGHHTGLDFPAAVGTAIKAVADGRVSQATSGGPYGIHAMLNHGRGLASLYAHMSKVLVSVGDTVRQGQTIGRVGATGNVTGPHLHLEARQNGRSVDPMKYLTNGGQGFTAGAKGAAQEYAKSQLSRFGWGASQFGPLKALWQGESGWNHFAQNPASGAYGIPQALPGSKMASAGADWRTNYRTQIDWGLGYIKHRPDYGSPAAAYAKWLARSPHWYDDGGYLPEGLSLVANGTGRPEPVFTSAQWDTLRANAGRDGGQVPNIVVESHTYLDGREVSGVIDQRIKLYDADTGRAIEAGRYV
ncbi:murein DD-endopeptidase MepM/ murein hydrolase activator NlpD [Streptomyces sp. KhCrAH-43]|uniref:aggregation-promoting factor C-terminal-like domain-containing protein n=1 Tax=unclassified Streptomyces TaxID=2593676 RepID=UPI000373063F|nr:MULTISPECIES: peptidoglycan DD-metalloendopeptidase family protein [unclassified Streptomyces]MYS37899.1 peptidoglycan DD-metalloendopeptidase family protein [Streptomyces sp. SID4920]MYX66086.1 peptidoglycan DD-metalloendopeptidase family protein [Streptomyces sp. SID8373]RAJ67569.1 murein DD-endopeptidase MepM/ murein hydrolase activator NlpD [Streptomyces sp. KhCrAH-43]